MSLPMTCCAPANRRKAWQCQSAPGVSYATPKFTSEPEALPLTWAYVDR